MKKYILSLMALVATMSINAQIIEVYKNGGTEPVATYTNTTTDKYKVVFKELPRVSSLTLSKTDVSVGIGKSTTLTVTYTPTNAQNKSVTWSSDNTGVATVDASGKVTGVAAGTATIQAKVADDSSVTATCTVTVTEQDENLLPGVFSVSGTKSVQFTKGNLQATYNGSSYTWGFAGHQYDYVGSAAGNTSIASQQNGKVVDLFGWSTDATNNNWGIHTQATNSEAYTGGSFKDWGGLFSDKNYSTLSNGEWTYLLNTRSQTNRYARANVNGTVGLLIFPDNYNGSTAVSGTGIANVNSSSAAFPDSSIPTDTWTTMESAGVVFLPAAGFRNGSSVTNVQTYGYYWASTAGSATDSNLLYFYTNGIYPSYSNKSYFGYSVRLVSAVSE